MIKFGICCKNVFVTASSLFSSASMPKSVKLKLKGGGYVDPESGLEDKVSNATFPYFCFKNWRLWIMLIIEVRGTSNEMIFLLKIW
jgi:hypothetical protein